MAENKLKMMKMKNKMTKSKKKSKKKKREQQQPVSVSRKNEKKEKISALDFIRSEVNFSLFLSPSSLISSVYKVFFFSLSLVLALYIRFFPTSILATYVPTPISTATPVRI